MRIVLVLGLFYVLVIDSIDIIKYIDRKPTPAENNVGTQKNHRIMKTEKPQRTFLGCE